ncbi:MAG: (2Fe-2S)-binding protein [Sarcina sp.]
MPEKITTNATEEGKVICNCKNVTLGEIHSAIAGGACTVEEIQAKTNAGTGCGKCKGLIEEILNKSK